MCQICPCVCCFTTWLYSNLTSTERKIFGFADSSQHNNFRDNYGRGISDIPFRSQYQCWFTSAVYAVWLLWSELLSNKTLISRGAWITAKFTPRTAYCSKHSWKRQMMTNDCTGSLRHHPNAGSPKHSPGPNTACEAIPFGLRSHFTWTQRDFVNNKK